MLTRNWEQGRRLNPLLHIMSVPSYHILYPAIKLTADHHTDFILFVNIFFSPITDFPFIHSLRFYQAFYLLPDPLAAFIPHHLITRRSYLCVYLLVLFWRREERTVGSSKGCFLHLYYLKNTYHYTDIYCFVNKKEQLSALFLTFYPNPPHSLACISFDILCHNICGLLIIPTSQFNFLGKTIINYFFCSVINDRIILVVSFAVDVIHTK